MQTWFAFFDIPVLGAAETAHYTASHVSLLPAVFLASLCIPRDKLVLAGRIVSLILAALLVVLCFVPSIRYSVAIGVLSGLMFGVVCCEVLMQFCYSLNPSERLFTIVVSNAVLCLIGLVPSFFTRGSTVFYVVCAVFCAATAVLQFACKEQPPAVLPVKAEKVRKHDRRLTLTVLLGLAGSVFSTGAVVLVSNMTVMRIGSGLLYLFYVGGIAACAVFYAVNRIVKNRISINVNMTFAATIVGLATSMFFADTAAAVASMLTSGAAFVLGMLCVYTGTARIADEYKSVNYLRMMVAVVGVFGGVGAPVIAGAMIKSGSNAIPLVAIAVSAVTLLIMLVISPYVSKKLDESPKEEEVTVPPQDVEAAEEHCLNKYGFTSRETEVAELLLQGFTMRQISGELGISQATVNTYCTAIYRKCGVNSRTELFILLK